MTERKDYFDRARDWAVDNRLREARLRRIAWTVAGIATAVALFEATALALLVPLKTVQPITLLVDKQTGYVEALDPLQPKRIGGDAAFTQSMLAQYVTAREGFDRATVGASYRRVALWSAGPARADYLALMPASNPLSPLQRVPAGTVVTTQVKSVSQLSTGTALVRFDTARLDRSGRSSAPQPWIAIVRYRYTEAPMRFEDRLVNPLGFQVTSYRRDAEAPPPPASLVADASPPSSPSPRPDAIAIVTAPARAAVPAGGRGNAPAIRMVAAGQVPLGSPFGRPGGGVQR